MIDLEKGEIDSQTETEVNFTHFRSIESLWIIVKDRSRKGKHSSGDREVNRTHFSQGESSDHPRTILLKRKRRRFRSRSMEESVRIIVDDRSKGRRD